MIDAERLEREYQRCRAACGSLRGRDALPYLIAALREIDDDLFRVWLGRAFGFSWQMLADHEIVKGWDPRDYSAAVLGLDWDDQRKIGRYQRYDSDALWNENYRGAIPVERTADGES